MAFLQYLMLWFTGQIVNTLWNDKAIIVFLLCKLTNEKNEFIGEYVI